MVQVRYKWRGFVNAVMNLRVPQNTGHFLSSLGTVSFSRRELVFLLFSCLVRYFIVNLVSHVINLLISYLFY